MGYERGYGGSSGGGGIIPPTTASAVQVDVTGEIAALSAASGGLAAADVLLGEDASASNAKVKASVTEIHGVAGLTAAQAAVTLASGDLVQVEDVSVSNTRGKATIADVHGVAGITNALSAASGGLAAGDLIAAEDVSAANVKVKATVTAICGVAGITDALTAKTTLVAADLVAIEDSAATNAKKKAALSDVLGAPGITNALSAASGGLAAGDLVAVEDVSAANIKAKATVTALHGVSGIINALTAKTVPVGADVIKVEDSAASFAPKATTLAQMFAALASGGSGLLPKYAMFTMNTTALANGGVVDFDTIVASGGQDDSDGFSVTAGGVVTPPSGNFLILCPMQFTHSAAITQDWGIYTKAAGGTPTTGDTHASFCDGIAGSLSSGSNNSMLPIAVGRDTFDGTKTCAVIQGTTAAGSWNATRSCLLFIQLATAT